MSWFSDIAGRAEDLLNKVDQTAATALQKSPRASSKRNERYIPEENVAPGVSYVSNNFVSSPMRVKSPRLPKMAENKTQYSSNVSTPRKKPKSDDEKLLMFLNNSENLPSERRKSETMVPSFGTSVDTVSTSTAEESNESVVPSSDSQVAIDIVDIASNNETATQGPTTETSAVDVLADKSTDITISSTPIYNSSYENASTEKSATATESVVEVQKRAQHAEAEMKRMMKKLDHWNSQISSNDRVVRELKERETDMVAAMDAKDAQLAILKVRLQEADQELQINRKIVDELTAENERIVKDHAEAASFQNKTVEILRDQLQQAEAELSKTKDSLHQCQVDYMNQRSKMEEEHRHLVESYTSLQKKWNDMSERNRDLLSQIKTANGNFESLQKEYSDYKLKAQRILLTKEKLISNLKDGNPESSTSEKFDTSSALLSAEIEAIGQERDLLKEELRRSNEMIENYRYEVQELEKNAHKDLAASQERCRIFKEQLEMEKVQREELQLLNVQLREEMELLKDDLASTKNTFQSRLQDREIEIEKLRRQLTAKSLSTVSQDELESRLHALTENLIQKQTVVEALSTEKNSLALQLERLEQQLREAQNYGAQQHTYVGISNNNITERKATSVFLDNPFDSSLTRKVKRVYGTIDALSIRLGVFFRRYPITRVFVIIYMLILHFWVMFVLLTYQPEIHTSEYEHVKKSA